jgi:hypothetical protein
MHREIMSSGETSVQPSLETATALRFQEPPAFGVASEGGFGGGDAMEEKKTDLVATSSSTFHIPRPQMGLAVQPSSFTEGVGDVNGPVCPLLIKK